MAGIYKDISRREFLAAGSAAAAVLVLPKFAFAAGATKRELEGPLGYLLCSSPFSAKSIDGKYGLKNNLFCVYDMDRAELTEFEIPVALAHDTHLHPVEKNLALVIEREGPYAALVDFKEKRTVRRIQASKDYYFTGHGTFTPDGKKLYMPEYLRGRPELSRIRIYDGQTFEPIGMTDTGFSAPHEFSWFPDGKRVAIGHYGLPSSYEPGNLHSGAVIYDTETDQVVREFRSPSPNFYMCHVYVSPEEKLFVLTHNSLAKRGPEADKVRKLKADYEKWIVERPGYFDFSMHPSAVLMYDTKTSAPAVAKINESAEQFQWGLSWAVNKKYGLAGGTHGLGGVITIQNLKTGELLHKFKLEGENPRGLAVTANQKYFVVTTDQGNLHYIDAEKIEIAHSENPKKMRYNFTVHTRCVPGLV